MSKDKSVTISPVHPAMQEFVEALGLDPGKLSGFALVMRPGTPVKMSVEMYVSEEQMKKAIGVVKHYELKVCNEHEPPLNPFQQKAKDKIQAESDLKERKR